MILRNIFKLNNDLLKVRENEVLEIMLLRMRLIKLKLLSRILILLTLMITIVSCTSYRAVPLVEVKKQQNMQNLTIALNKLLKVKKNQYKFDPSDGFDLTEIAMLAVLNNPDLKNSRAKMAIVNAQVFKAGLLPDPQLATNIEFPTSTQSGAVNAWGMGISFDLISLITRPSRIGVEKARQKQISLKLLWQEWQVMQQARILAIKYQLEKQQQRLLENMKNLYQKRYLQSKKGLQQGNITLDVNGTDLTALIDILSQIAQLQQLHNQTRHELNYFLGLKSEVTIKLSALPEEKPLTDALIENQLQQLPKIRPDLLALKAGYLAQEARVRGAILAQFPSFNLGISRLRDTGKLLTRGFNIGFNLPLFNANRGTIATERATRKQLFVAYQARLAATDKKVKQLIALRKIIKAQQQNLNAYLPELKRLVDMARRGYQKGNINALTFINMESTWVSKRLEQLALKARSWENRIALQTLLAWPES